MDDIKTLIERYQERQRQKKQAVTPASEISVVVLCFTCGKRIVNGICQCPGDKEVIVNVPETETTAPESGSFVTQG